jgi:bifunctional non-homologous end joining protein LigD
MDKAVGRSPTRALKPSSGPPHSEPSASGFQKPSPLGIVEPSDPFPGRITPSLPTLVDTPPHAGQWWHEIKWDRSRLIGFRQGNAVRLQIRNGHDWTRRFPAIAAALASLPVEGAIIDGEAVMLDANGVSSFPALQAALGAEKGPGVGLAHEAVLYAFDLLYRDGWDLREQPLEERKRELVSLLGPLGIGALPVSEHVLGSAPACCGTPARWVSKAS